MKIKTQNAFTALSFSVETNIAGIFQYVRVKAAELYRDAAENNLEVTGPVYWIYTGMDGHPDTVFNLDIVLPVTTPEMYNGNFAVKTIPALKSLSTTHVGAWEKLPGTYHQLFMETGKQNLAPNGICREVYLHMDFQNPENNLTEVQVGIV
jgi:effector-binding domain-containing protein